MTFEVITLFPEVLKPYLGESIMGRAIGRKLFKVNFHNLRDFSIDKKHKHVDDRVYGGGPGMVIQIQPIIKAVEFVKSKVLPAGKQEKSKIKVILFTPAGKQFDDKMAVRLAKDYNNLILICGHYEGIDARLKSVLKTLKLSTLELSIGPYVLTGGELPAVVLIDSVSRQIPGVLGKQESVEEKRFGVGVPVYTRPEVFLYKKRKYPVPKVLLSGDHAAINKWRLEHKAI